MEYLRTFRNRIIDELKKRKWSRKDLAQRIDIDTTLINAMLRSERRFNEDQVLAIANALNMEPYCLFTDDHLVPESQFRESLKKMHQLKDDFQLVEEVVPEACADLSNIAQKSIIGYQAFDKEFLKDMFKPFLTRTSDNSMFPTITEGDLVLFNRDPDKLKEPDPNKLYLVNLAPGELIPNLTVKRVGFSRSDWTLTLFPDNRQFQIEKYKMNEKNNILDYVIGIAVWVGKKLEKN